MRRTRSAPPQISWEKWGFNPPEEKKIRRHDDRVTILMGEKAPSAARARRIAAGHYPVYCQVVGRRPRPGVQCHHEYALDRVLKTVDWRVERVVIRKAYGGAASPRPAGDAHPRPAERPKFSAPGKAARSMTQPAYYMTRAA